MFLKASRNINALSKIATYINIGKQRKLMNWFLSRRVREFRLYSPAKLADISY